MSRQASFLPADRHFPLVVPAQRLWQWLKRQWKRLSPLGWPPAGWSR